MDSKKGGTARKTEEPKITPQGLNAGDDWRWAYRKEVMARLREYAVKSDGLEKEVVKTALGLSSSDRKYILREADFLIASLKSSGNGRKAEEFKKIITFYKSGKNESDLEDIYRMDPGSDASFAAEFLLGDYYEKHGFYPEASGYFNKISRESRGGFILSAALFKKAQLLFFENKFSEAKSSFEKAVRAGSIEARLWLANTLLIRGETNQAWEIYKENLQDTKTGDPITLMSIGDISVVRGDFAGARAIFERLANNFKKDELITAFFTLKSGDVYLSEGRKDEAIRIYRKTKAIYKGEGWNMAALSLADALASESNARSMMESMGIYQAVSEGDYISSEFASIRLIATGIRLDKFEEAAANLKAFSGRFPTSPLRINLSSLEGDLVYGWLNSLFDKGDYYGVVKLYSVYGAPMPFGRKAVAYLKIGKAYAKLGLSPEAANNLDRAVKMGNDGVAEEAMFALARVYLSQGDASSAERLLKIFRTHFPMSSHERDAERKLLLDIAYMKKDYEKIADTRLALDDPQALMMKAHSLLKLGRKKEAAIFLGKTAVRYTEVGDIRKAASAYIEIADTYFRSGNYENAVTSYRKAVESLKNGKGTDDDRSWALYRIALSYSRLHKDDLRNEALTELDGLHDEYGRWAQEIFKEPGKSL